jgi:hypothetical protein
MSKMYMRKHHKEDNSVRGSSPRWKDTFAIDDKGARYFSYAKDRGMIQGGAMVTEMHRTKTWLQGENE